MEKELIELKLPRDVTRCFGDDCSQKNNCLRWLTHNDNYPNLSYMQHGAFIGTECVYFIPAKK